MKKVRFNKQKIIHYFVDDIDSKESRKGNWHWIIYERRRFENKCKIIESKINYIFNKKHRYKIYYERFAKYKLRYK